MKFFILLYRMLEKDLKLFYRDKKTFIMVFLAPIVIMLILSNIFNVDDTRSSIRGIPLGLCNLDDREIDLETDVFTIVSLEGDDCEAVAHEQVKSGILRASVVIPKNFSSDIEQGQGADLTSIIDNSKAQTAIVATAAMKAFVADLNEQIGTEFISAAWVRLNELNTALKSMDGELEVAKDYALRSRIQIQDAKEKLDSVDIPSAKKTLISINSSYHETLLGIDSAIADLDIILNATDLNLSAGIIPKVRLDLNLSELDSLYDVQCINSTLPVNATLLNNYSSAATSDLCDALNISLEKLEELNEKNLLDNALTSALVNKTKVYADAIGRMLNRSESVRDKLAAIRDDAAIYEDNISTVFAMIDQLEQEEATVRSEIDHVDEMLINYTERIIMLQGELSAATRDLDKYTAKEPKNIIRAVSLDEERSFPNRKVLEFMTPGIITLILLFITMFISSSLIVAEKKSGCMARNFLAPVSVFTFLFGKTLYLMILAAIEIACMIVVSCLLGVEISITVALILTLLMVSLCFVTLGMLIGAFSRTENTSLLSSLVIGLPMLFLSGLFFPFEIMPNVMRTIGYYLPLTLSVRGLESILIYSKGLDMSAMIILAGISALLFFIAALLTWLKPMADD